MPRQNFSAKVVRIIAMRSGFRCSNPKCRSVTTGPHSDSLRSLSIGVAAHICAAALGGPRYDDSQSKEQRTSPENGIWLCQTCSRLIDTDDKRYSVELLQKWKHNSEQASLKQIETGIWSTATVREESAALGHGKEYWDHRLIGFQLVEMSTTDFDELEWRCIAELLESFSPSRSIRNESLDPTQPIYGRELTRACLYAAADVYEIEDIEELTLDNDTSRKSNLFYLMVLDVWNEIRGVANAPAATAADWELRKAKLAKAISTIITPELEKLGH